MKVILQKDIRALGKTGDIKEVSDGYARNYLIPRGLAIEATSGNIKVIAEQKEHALKKEQKEAADARELAERLKGTTVNFVTKVGEGGRLFGSITSKDVAEHLQKTLKLDIDKRKLEIEDTIKTLGSHPVKIHLYKGVVAEITVNVVAE